MKFLYYLLLTFGPLQLCLSQDCGTPFARPSRSLDSLRTFGDGFGPSLVSLTKPIIGEVIEYRVNFHLFDKDEMLLDEDLQNSIDRVDTLFMGAGIQFVIKNILQHNQPAFNNFFGDEYNERRLYEQYGQNNQINIYLVQSITDKTQSQISAYTYTPVFRQVDYQANMIIITVDAIYDQSTLAHEMGHFFGLLHTHGEDGQLEKEYVDRRNCSTAGDYICDTPADPNLNVYPTMVRCDGDSSVYTDIGLKDLVGKPYRPMVNNIMSYAPASCRNAFTFGQFYTMMDNARLERQHLDHRIVQKKGYGKFYPNLRANDVRDNFFPGLPHILIVVKEGDPWSERTMKELIAEPVTGMLKKKGAYVTLFDVDKDAESIFEFFPNRFNEAQKEAFYKILLPDIAHYPSYFIIRFDIKKENCRAWRWRYGYQNPRMLTDFISESIPEDQLTRLIWHLPY